MKTEFEFQVLGKKVAFEVHPHVETLSEMIRASGPYSKNDLEVIATYLGPNGIFLDIGANIGWHTVCAGVHLNGAGKVFAFEPESLNLALLEKNIKRNALNNVIVVPLALSDESGEAQLHTSGHNFGDHILNLRAQSTAHLGNQKVKTIRLDQWIQEQSVDANLIQVIKMDVQGSEPAILDGARQFFKDHRPVIIMEYSPKHIRAVGRSIFDIFSFIDRYRYQPYELLSDTHLSKGEYLKPLAIWDLIRKTQELENAPIDLGIDLLLLPAKA